MKVLAEYAPTFRTDLGGTRGIAFNSDGSVFGLCGTTRVSTAFAGLGDPAVVPINRTDGKPKLMKPKDTFQGTACRVSPVRGGHLRGRWPGPRVVREG